MKLKLTYKKHPKDKGLARVANPYQDIDIKLNGKNIGLIKAPNWRNDNNMYKVGVTIIKEDIMEDGNSNCNWKWIWFNAGFASPEKAKEWVGEWIEKIVEKYNLYSDED
jgi:hypothetical protein